jgi:ABC-type dipeptide/oligopeptide/nickel transport system permease component
MMRYLLSRLSQCIAVILFVATLCFALLHSLPGDPAMRIAAGRYGPDGMSAMAAEQVRQELGLDQPLLIQYGNSLLQLARFDLGYSLVTGERVSTAIQSQLGYTLLLGLSAWLLSLVIAIPLGAYSGWRRAGVFDRSSLVGSVLIRSVPPFIIALFMMWLFSYHLGWLPAAGFGSWQNLVLPSFTLALGLSAVSSRVIRNATVAVRQSSYFAFARYKGLPTRALLTNHTLRNAAIPVIAYLAVQFIYLVEGVVVVESLFAYPGIGHALVHAIIDRDVPMLQGSVMVMSLLFIALSALTDTLTRWLNPRQGEQYAH